MKKILFMLFALVVVLCCALGLVACRTNEDKVVDVTNIKLNKTEITLTEGEDEILIVTLTPADATDISMEWTSSDTSVATVDSGSVVAIAAGEATITVTAHNSVSATCVVTVTAKQEEPPVKYAVTFYARGGKFENGNDSYEVLVNDGDKISAVNVTRDGKYSFLGWYKDVYRTELWDFDTDIIFEETDLYAGWKYINSYQSVIDALTDRIKTDRNDKSMQVEILSIFTDGGHLCFVEKDSTGVFSYSTNIGGFDKIIDNTELISEIPYADLTLQKDYNYTYTSDDNSLIADYMALKYGFGLGLENYEVIYSCVSEWELDNEHITTGGPFYSCKIKAIVGDYDGHVFDYSVTVVAGVADFNAVLGGMALSQEYDEMKTELGETAYDFFVEYLKEQKA